MSRTDPQFKLRIPAPMHEAVKALATRNRRSMNAQIVLMLERGLEKESAPTAATVEARMSETNLEGNRHG